MGKRILVTGGAGLVGSHTAEYYAKRGSEVVILDNLLSSQLFNYDKEKAIFIYCSTNKVYGENVDKIPLTLIIIHK